MTPVDNDEISVYQQSVEGIDFFLEFSNPHLAEDYKSFKIANSSLVPLVIATAVLTGMWAAYWILVFIRLFNIFSLTTMIISGFPIVLLWLLITMKSRIPLKSQLGDYRQFFTNIESMIIIGVSISTSLVVIMRAVNGQCVSDSFEQLWYCSPSRWALPSDVVYVTLTLPLFFKILLPFIAFYTVIFSFVISLFTVIVSMIFFQTIASASMVIVLTLLTAAIVYCYRLQHLQLYLAVNTYQQTLRLRQQDFIENAARLRNEMANVLSSICHDMKSVSDLFFLYYSYSHIIHIDSFLS